MGKLSQENLDSVLDDISVGMELFGKIHTAWKILVEQVESIKISGRTHHDYIRRLIQNEGEDQTLLISKLDSVVFHEQSLHSKIIDIFEYEEDLSKLMKCLIDNADFISSSIVWKPMVGNKILKYYSRNKVNIDKNDLLTMYYTEQIPTSATYSNELQPKPKIETKFKVEDQQSLWNKSMVDDLIKNLVNDKNYIPNPEEQKMIKYYKNYKVYRSPFLQEYNKYYDHIWNALRSRKILDLKTVKIMFNSPNDYLVKMLLNSFIDYLRKYKIKKIGTVNYDDGMKKLIYLEKKA